MSMSEFVSASQWEAHMSEGKATVYTIAGSLQEIRMLPHEFDRLQKLQRQGLTGKELIHEVLTDDWGAPPRYVDFSGYDSNGNKVSVRVEYE